MCIFAPLKTRNRLGLLAQLVQSIWFTPRGSGVRIPQGPQTPQEIEEFFLCEKLLFWDQYRINIKTWGLSKNLRQSEQEKKH